MAQIQIGTVAYRRTDGSVCAARPIYRDAPEEEREAADAAFAARAAKIFAAKFRAYIDAQPKERAR